MITSNILKIIAIIAMLIDHIGSYFVSDMNSDVYFILRSIGRIAMPIFLYILVQGFFYTSNLKKYIFRIFCLATVTQIVLLVMGIVNEEIFPHYYSRLNEYMGVLFSYFLSLVMITMIDRKIIIPKLNKYGNMIIRVLIVIAIILIYLNIDIEFDMRIPFMCLELYIIEKMFRNSETGELFLKRKYERKIEKVFLKIIYIFLMGVSFVTSLDFSTYHPGYKYAIVFSLIPIALYNGERGRKNKWIQIAFYSVFPVQHMVLYLLAMIFA